MAAPRAAGTAELTTVERRAPAHPLIGWRYWQLPPATGLIRSVTHRRFEWRPGQALRATCLIGGHEAPAPGCACGIHASPDLATQREQGLCLAPGAALVTGTVALWGTVVADDHGLRAEYAAPAGLWLVTVAGSEPDELALEQLGAYRVPVATMTPAEAMGDVAAAILNFQFMSR